MIENHCHFIPFHLSLSPLASLSFLLLSFLLSFLPSFPPSFLSFIPLSPLFFPSSSLSFEMCLLLCWARSNGWRQINGLYFIFSSIAFSRHCFTGKYHSFQDIITSSWHLELTLTASWRSLHSTPLVSETQPMKRSIPLLEIIRSWKKYVLHHLFHYVWISQGHLAMSDGFGYHCWWLMNGGNGCSQCFLEFKHST